MTINPLPWDSDFFGFPIGACDLSQFDEYSKTELIQKGVNFKLIYCFSKTLIDQHHLDENFLLVDNKITLKKNSEKIIAPYNKNVLPWKTEATPELYDLAFQSGEFSRFNLDPHFKNNEFEKLYKTWIDKSLKQNSTDRVFIHKHKNVISGSISFSIKSDRLVIELIAVDKNCRGSGIGKTLLEKANHIAFENGLTHIQVSTQCRNATALNFYLKNKFTVIDSVFIYHYWNS